MRISVSRLKTFKACRRAYFFQYEKELVPVEQSDAIRLGLRYHELVEKVNKGEFEIDEAEFPTRDLAMAVAYQKYVFPQLPKIVETEKWLEMPIGDDVLVGRVDAIAEDGIVEHKSVSAELNESYEYDLQWDEQILAYMALTGKRKVYYTACRKPTIRQKQNESDDEYFKRMCEWYDTDTESKIRILVLTRTDEEVSQFLEELKMTVEEMKTSKFLYRNTLHCFRWGRQCEYAPICLNYDENQTYVNFKKKEVIENVGTEKNF